MASPESSVPGSLNLSVPVTLPSPDDIREIIREAAREAALQQLAWLSFSEAAKHIGVSKRTFERKKRSLGIPVAEIDGIKRIARQDLDAIMRAHLSTPETTVIDFPSMAQRVRERTAA